MRRRIEPRDLGCYAVGVILALLLIGCGSERRTNRASAPARYGEPTGKASAQIPRVRADATNREWSQTPFAFVQTELSPATLLHCASNDVSFFTHLADYGLGGPTYAACSTRAGMKSYKAGEHIEALWLEECWILVWFAGAKGWTNWDSPWVVYLQHKPSAVRFHESGLHLRFPQEAGDIV